ncbi:hypothetical protein BBJ28_00000508 [Nothophytophthora sp. Chile5]|nr:hypothetical protein BBJ28_00000508 [Nothophytophthora sp. Chile5]
MDLMYLSIASGDCEVAANGKTYALAQFHVHTGSEHKVKGKAQGGEIHFVHKNMDGSALLVVGLFLKASESATTDPWLVNFLEALDMVGDDSPVPTTLDSYSALILQQMTKGHAFNYPGSLTTPPCSEIVDWWVVQKPVSISSADYERIVSNLAELDITDHGKNARPVQPLNGRTITVY